MATIMAAAFWKSDLTFTHYYLRDVRRLRDDGTFGLSAAVVAQQAISDVMEQVDELYENYAFSHVIELLLGHVHWANAFVQRHEPWTLVKAGDTTSDQHLRVVLHVAMETLRVCGILQQPVVPRLTDRLLTQLGVAVDCRRLVDVQNNVCKNARTLGERVTLLKRIQS